MNDGLYAAGAVVAIIVLALGILYLRGKIDERTSIR
jgi:hypothetical protein